MVRATYSRVPTSSVAIMVALLIVMLAPQKPAQAGAPIDDGLCLPWGGNNCPPETEIASGPPQNGTVSSDRVTFDFTGYDDKTATTDLKFDCRLDGGEWSVCTSPREYTGLSEGPHTFEVRAKVSSTEIDATPAGRTWTVDTTKPPPPDTTPPETHISIPRTEPSPDAAFQFTGRDNFGGTAIADLKFECSLDGAAFEACTSPKEYTGLSNGRHNFEVRARDSSGNVDASPASYQYRVDTTPPDTVITSYPSDPSGGTDLSFRFFGRDDVSNLSFYSQCRYSLSGSNEWTSTFCTSPFDFDIERSGTYTFEVAAHDGWGRPDTTPATYTWTVDAAAPSIPVITSPANDTFYNVGNFTISGTAEEDSTVELFENASLVDSVTADGSGNWSLSLNDISQGEHTYSARAKDAVNNTSDPSDSFKITVDASAPMVESTVPVPGARGVLRGANVTATFSDRMDESTLTAQNLKLVNVATGKRVNNAALRYDDATRTLTMDPFGSSATLLARSSKYKVTIATGAKNRAGISLDQSPGTSGSQPKSWTFTTGSR